MMESTRAQPKSLAGPLRISTAILSIMQIGLASPLSQASSADLRLNHIQVIGTHNSYHREVSLAARSFFEQIVKSYTPPQNFYYSHASLPDQLTYQSVRSLELDVYADYVEPGQFAHPLIDSAAKLPARPEEWQKQMREPGAKVLHVSDLDVNSTCPTLKICLSGLRDWSNQNPSHIPIIIDVEFKNVEKLIAENVPGAATGEPWDADNLALLDEEIRSILGNDKIITPDDVRLQRTDVTTTASNLTLEEAVLQHGWPTLDASRGKFLFVMDNNPGPDSLRNDYRRDGHESLEGRVIFTNSEPGSADAAFIKSNDPSGENLAKIQALVRKGYLVRTRADEPIDSVLEGDSLANKRLSEALESGAQVVSTDWPGVGMASRYNSEYVAKLPNGGVVRCNPVNAPGYCNNIDLEIYVAAREEWKLTRQDV